VLRARERYTGPLKGLLSAFIQ